MKYRESVAVLKKTGAGYSDKEVQAQQTLVDALDAQVTLEGKISALKNIDKNNASTSTGKELSALRAEGERQAAEHARKMGELSLQIDREQTEARLTTQAASIAERLAADIHLADEETRIQTTANQSLIAALDKGGKDYNNQLKALKDKAEEITRQHEATIAGLQSKASEAQYREDLQNLEQSEREKIEATLRGSAERIAAIDAAIKEEESKNLQNAASYRDLQKQRVEAQRQYDEEAGKLAAEAGKEAAENNQKMGELMLAMERSNQALADSSHRITIQQRMAEDVEFADKEFALKQTAMQQEAAALDKGAKDYENKLRAIQNKELQMIREHENEVTQIKQEAQIRQNQSQMAAMTQLKEMTASGLTKVLMGHQSFATMMDSIGDQVVSGMLRTALMSIMTADMDKERQAASAARKMFLAGAQFPFPVNVVMAPLMGAAAFASMMAFEGGGIVPGVGRGDVIPAMLTPGEGIVPGGVMDGLQKMARSGTTGGGTTVNVHVRPNYHLQALDTGGMEKILETHSRTLAKHVSNEMRRMNHS